MKSVAYAWLVMGFLLMAAEILTPGFVLVFFGASAILVGVLCVLFKISTSWQLIWFAMLSVVTMVTLRKRMKGLFSGRSGGSPGIDSALAGRSAIVTERIEPPMVGKVELDGVQWNAASDKTLEVGTLVTVLQHESLTLKVEQRILKERE